MLRVEAPTPGRKTIHNTNRPLGDHADALIQFDHGVPIVAPPRAHRDSARSLYCKDPDGNTGRLLYDPVLGAESGAESRHSGTESYSESKSDTTLR